MEPSTHKDSVICLDIKALGPIFGVPGTLMHRQSIQRAATTNQRRYTCQVIIKHTFSLKETNETPLKRSNTLSRSRSLMSTNHVPLLAPKRSDRHRIEQLVSDVWTKDRLPFPGMAGNMGGHLIRTSASTVMRKISLASMTTSGGSLRRRGAQQVVTKEGDLQSSHVLRVLGNQTDGASSLRYESRDADPTRAVRSILEYQDANPYAKRTVTEEAKTAPDGNDVDWSRSRQVSETSTVVAHRELKEYPHENGKPRKPKTLFKAFSTDSIRAWFL